MRNVIYLLALILCAGILFPLAALGNAEFEPGDSVQMATAGWERSAESALWNKAVKERLFTSDKLPINAYTMDAYDEIHSFRNTLFNDIRIEMRSADYGNKGNLSKAVIAKHLLKELLQVDTSITDAEKDLLACVAEISVSRFQSDQMLPESCPEQTQVLSIPLTSTNINQRESKPGAVNKMIYVDNYAIQNMGKALCYSKKVIVDYYSLFLYIWEDNPDSSNLHPISLPSFVFPQSAIIYVLINIQTQTHHNKTNQQALQGVLI